MAGSSALRGLPPSLASFLSALAFPPGLGLSRAPPPGLSGFLEVGRFSWGWGTGFVWEIWGIGVKVGEKVVSGCKGLKKRFLHLCQSVSLPGPSELVHYTMPCKKSHGIFTALWRRHIFLLLLIYRGCTRSLLQPTGIPCSRQGLLEPWCTGSSRGTLPMQGA